MSGVCDTCKRDKCRLRMDGLKMCDMRLSESNYERLFGTPERAAETLANNCDDYNLCDGCSADCESHDCYDALLEWLESEVSDG